MTAHAMSGAREKYLAAGMNDYISKPIEAELLFSKLAGIAAKNRFALTSVLVGVPAPPADSVSENWQPPQLDLERLGRLENLFSRPQCRDFISLSLVDLEQHLARITECHIQDDLYGILLQAHTIVGVAGNLGAMQTSAAAQRLEAGCRSGDRELSYRTD